MHLMTQPLLPWDHSCASLQTGSFSRTARLGSYAFCGIIRIPVMCVTYFLPGICKIGTHFGCCLRYLLQHFWEEVLRRSLLSHMSPSAQALAVCMGSQILFYKSRCSSHMGGCFGKLLATRQELAKLGARSSQFHTAAQSVWGFTSGPGKPYQFIRLQAKRRYVTQIVTNILCVWPADSYERLSV